MLASTIKNIKSPIDELILCLTMAMDLDDGQKLYHCWHVAVIADMVAQELELPTRPYLFLAGLLHDVGGIGAPIHVMHYMATHSNDPLSTPEVELHPFFGAQALRIIPGLNYRHFIADILLQHHEHVDGTGFPSKISGTEMLPEAAIVHAADLFDIYINTANGSPDFHTITQNMMADKTLSRTAVEALSTVLKTSNLPTVLFDESLLKATVQQLYAQHHTALFDSQLEEDKVLEGILSLVSTVIDQKHSYTQGHSVRVAAYSAELAQYLGFSASDVDMIHQAGILHDVGKLSVPREILDKRGKLEPDQWYRMKRHARLSWDILQAFPTLERYSFAALHHERWDGQGYPFGLSGTSIPVFGRIMAVADALDAMTSHRPYRPIWTFGKAIEEIEKRAGSQFDPEIAAAAAQVFCPAKQNGWVQPNHLFRAH